jgi:predicted transcriptional regulator of viral defense system
LHPDRILAALARRQHGVVSREQLALFGFTPRVIQRLRESGHLQPLHHGVYAVGHRPVTREAAWSAAALACGLDATLSHVNAGAHLSFVEKPSGIHVTAPSLRRRPGITVHRSELHPNDRTIHDGIPVTTPGRTLLDLAGTLPPRPFKRAYEEADRLDLVVEDELRALIARSNGHRGVGPLTAQLNETFATAPTKRELEARFLELVHDSGLPEPEVNVWVEGHLVDAYWPAHELVVELDSRTFHRTDAKVERDYAATADLKLAGKEVLRFTWKQVTMDQAVVLKLLSRSLPQDAGMRARPRT